MAKHKKSAADGAHFEVEKGYRLRKAEYAVLKELLPTLGFAFQKKSQITDFVVPTRGKTTRRMRIENVKSSADGKTGVTCIKGFKNHPIKGKKGRNVRFENEHVVSPKRVLSFILNVMGKLGAPIPYYSKTRLHFHGVYDGVEITITLDRARGLHRYSGRYIEIETLLPLGSKKSAVKAALKVIDKLAAELLQKRKPKISYRKMLMKTWTLGRISNKKLLKVRPHKLKKARVNYRKLLNRVAKPGSKRTPAK